MRLSERDLMEKVNAYVKQRRLLKYRFYSEDENDMHHILHWKCENKELLTNKEIEYIKTLSNVVVDNGSSFYFIDFTGVLTKW